MDSMRRDQLQRDAFLDANYRAAPAEDGDAKFDYAKDTKDSHQLRNTITLTELEMMARHINQPGGCQPFGAFLLVHEASATVTSSSSNAVNLLGKQADEMLGMALHDVFVEAEDLIHVIAEMGSGGPPTPFRATPIGDGGNMEPVELIMVKSLQGVSMDIEPGKADSCLADDQEQTDRGVKRLETCAWEDIQVAVSEEIQRLAGYERVMCYKFHEDCHGEVVGEATADADTRSYLHLHFPATDIPQRARDLFLLNRARIIVDSSAKPAVLVCQGERGLVPSSISLATSTTRAVHPAHLEYLQNWGVVGTLVFSIRVSGKLWGLVCCNAEKRPRFLSYESRMRCATVVEMFAKRIQDRQDSDEPAEMKLFQNKMAKLMKAAGGGEHFDPQTLVADGGPNLLDILPDCHGAAVVMREGTLHSIGCAPSLDELRAIARWRLSDAGVASITCMKDVYPGEVNPEVCGMLSVPLLNGSVVMWFRKEHNIEIKWSGKPGESKTRVPGSTFLPLSSFETFIQTLSGSCEPWGAKWVERAGLFGDALDKAASDASNKCVFTVHCSTGRIKLFNDTLCHMLHVSKQQALGMLLTKVCPLPGGNLVDGLSRITANGPHDLYLRVYPQRAQGSKNAASIEGIELHGIAWTCRDCLGSCVIMFVGEKVLEGAERNKLAATMDDLLSGSGKMAGAYQDTRKLIPKTAKEPLRVPDQLSVLDKIRIPCWLVETEPDSQRFVWGNEAACACFGKSIQDFVCMDLHGLKTVSEVLNLQDWHHNIKSQRRILTTRETFFPDNQAVTFDLEMHPVDACFPGEDTTKVLAFVVGMPVMMQDSGQIECGRSHEMLQQSRIMTMLFTMNGKLVQANVAARAHYFADTSPEVEAGIDPSHSMTLQTLFESCVWESVAAMNACMHDMFKTCMSSCTYEIEVLKKHGFLQNTLNSKRSPTVESGEGVHDAVHLLQCFFARDPLTGEKCVLINETDISRMKGVQVDLIVSKRKQEQFLASVSHELRTPLNGILGLSQSLMADPGATEKMKKTLMIIMSSGHRLSTLVNDILDATSMKESRFVLNFQEVSFKEVADHVVCAIMPMVGKRVTLINDVPSKLPPIYSDAGRLSQVLTNLLGNSVKFTHKGHIRVSANISSRHLTFAVEDTGIGIPPEKTKEIFEPFVKGDMSSTWNYSGSGLGLSVVKSLVEAFGGFISLESKIDPEIHGTKFTVKLPLHTPQDHDKEVAGMAKPTEAQPHAVAHSSVPAEMAPLARILSQTGVQDPEKLREVLQLHQTGSLAIDQLQQEHDNSGAKGVLLCQVGRISAEASEPCLGSFSRALVNFEMKLQEILRKHNAHTCVSKGEEHTIIADTNIPEGKQIEALRDVAHEILTACRSLTFEWPEMRKTHHIQVRMAICAGFLEDGRLLDGQCVVYGQCLLAAWELLHTVPSMEVRYSVEAVDVLKSSNEALSFSLDMSGQKPKGGSKDKSPAKEGGQAQQKSYLENRAPNEDAVAKQKVDDTALWLEDQNKKDESIKAAVNFVMGLNSDVGKQSKQQDFQTFIEVLKKYTHLYNLLAQHMSAHLLACSQNVTTTNSDPVTRSQSHANGSLHTLVKQNSVLKLSSLSEKPETFTSSMKNYTDLYEGIEIMSVDDDPINQMVIENLLQPCGYKLTICMDGIQCLEHIAERGYIPDLLLLDVMMPHLSGYEVCERLRASHGTTALPIVMISAKMDHDSVVKCFQSGGNDFVHKPFHREELLARIKMQLNLKDVWRLQVEHELSKSTMRSMMPEHVVDRLHRGERAVVDELDCVTILFADIVSYTNMSTQLKPTELVGLLNDMFTIFDSLCSTHGVTKVETIGDAYMIVVAGEQNASRMANMALDMINSVKDLEVTGAGVESRKVQIRIGMHSGPVVAAVLGETMLRYSYIGETVNLASRMESNGYSMNIVMSEVTKQLLEDCDDNFKFVSLGEKHIKGKGWMFMWAIKHEDLEWEKALQDCQNSPGRMPRRASRLSLKAGDEEDEPESKGQMVRTSSPIIDANKDVPSPMPGFGKSEDARMQATKLASETRLFAAQGPRQDPTELVNAEVNAEEIKTLRSKLLATQQELKEAISENRNLEKQIYEREMLTDSQTTHDSGARQLSASSQMFDMHLDSFRGGDVVTGPPKPPMHDFLTRINFASKIPTFDAHGVTAIDSIMDLSEVELSRLGISSLGEQVKLRRSADAWIRAVHCGLLGSFGLSSP